MESYSDWQPYIEYAKGHPFIAILLGALLVAIIWSFVKQLLKIAVVVLVVLLGALYVTDSEVQREWRENHWIQQAGAKAKQMEKLGRKALTKGKDILELLPEKNKQE